MVNVGFRIQGVSVGLRSGRSAVELLDTDGAGRLLGEEAEASSTELSNDEPTGLFHPCAGFAPRSPLS